MTLGKNHFENIEGKGENANKQHFLLFLQCFQPYERQKSSFEALFSSASDFNSDLSTDLSFGKELNPLLNNPEEKCL